MTYNDNIQKREQQAYKKLERTINLYVVGQTQRDEVLNLIYEWSELAIELEQQCNN